MTPDLRAKWIARLTTAAEQAEADGALAVASVLFVLLGALEDHKELDLMAYQAEFTRVQLELLKTSIGNPSVQ